MEGYTWKTYQSEEWFLWQVDSSEGVIHVQGNSHTGKIYTRVKLWEWIIYIKDFSWREVYKGKWIMWKGC